MKTFPKFISSILLLLASTASTQSFSTVITFEDAVSIGSFTSVFVYNEGGYSFTTGPDSLIIASRSSDVVLTYALPFIPSNENVAAGFLPYGHSVTTTIRRNNGELFSLENLDILMFPLSAPTDLLLHISGIKSDLSSFDTTFSLNDRTWHTMYFSENESYKNLKELSISGVAATPGIIAFDNINVSEVPVPTSAWLLGSSLLGLASLRKKKTN